MACGKSALRVGILTFSVMSGLCRPVNAQTWTVIGFINDSMSGRPVVGAHITMSDFESRVLGTGVSGSDGHFAVSIRGSLSPVMVIRQVGYRPLVVPIEPQDSAPRTYYLQALPVNLDPVQVEAEATAALVDVQYLQKNGFYRRYRRSDGRFVTPEMI
jgi:hypothetical protein